MPASSHQLLAVSALLCACEAIVDTHVLHSDDEASFRDLLSKVRRAFDHLPPARAAPPPRIKPTLRVVRVGDHDAEVVRFNRVIEAVRFQMAIDQVPA